jgi:hypothetical protein
MTDPVLKTYEMRRNHYGDAWAVDEVKHPLDKPPFPSNTLLVVTSKRDAVSIEIALNSAYSGGIEYGAWKAREEDKDKEKHQDYANYETFVIAQWIDNDEEILSYIRTAGFIYSMLHEESTMMGAFAQHVRDYATGKALSWIKSKKDCFAGSLVSSALSSVDWLELATQYVTEGE